MDPRLAEQPATRWDRLVAVLEDVDPERAIDASHIIERERRLNMTDLELFYILAMHYQDTESRVLNEVLSLYVLISTWMSWLASCDKYLSVTTTSCGRLGARSGHNGGAQDLAVQPTVESSVTVHHRLHPSFPSSRARLPTDEDTDSSVTGSVAGSFMASTVASPLARSATTIPGGLTASDSCVVPLARRANSSLLQMDDVMTPPNTRRNASGSRRAQAPAESRFSDNATSKTSLAASSGGSPSRPPLATPPTPAKSFLAPFNLPPNWMDEGTVNFLRDGRLLCELIEKAVGLASSGGCRGGSSARLSEVEELFPQSLAGYDTRFPSLADIDRLTAKMRGSGGGSGNALDQLSNVTVQYSRPRWSRRSKASRTMQMLEEQGKTVAATEKSVSRLNQLCERLLGWDPTANNGEHFSELPGTDRMLRPLNADDKWIVYRLHWMAVALFQTVNDPRIVPLPPRVSFLLTQQTPDAFIDDSEENSELALLIATKCSCLPHHCQTQVILVDGNVIQLSHPKVHPQPLRFPCCVVDGEAFVFLEAKGLFTPLWRVLRRTLKQWDNTTWKFEQTIMEQRAAQVLQVGSAVAAMSATSPLSRASVCVSAPLTPYGPASSWTTNARHVGTPSCESPTLFPAKGSRPAVGSGTGSPVSPRDALAASHSGSPSGNRGRGTSFNLTITTSALRPGRAVNANSAAALATTGGGRTSLSNTSLTHAQAHSGRAPAQSLPNRSFVDDFVDECSGASFGGVAMVRGGRRVPNSRVAAMQSFHESGSSMAPPSHIPHSVSTRAGRASPGPPQHASNPFPALAKRISTAAAAAVSLIAVPNAAAVTGEAKPPLSPGLKSQAVPARSSRGACGAESFTSVTSPLRSPRLEKPLSSGVFLSAKSRADDDVGGDAMTSTAKPRDGVAMSAAAATSERRGVSGEGERPPSPFSAELERKETLQYEGDKYESDSQPPPVPSATLSAVHTQVRVNVEANGNSNDCEGSDEDAEEETFLPQHDDSEGSHMNNHGSFFHSELLRVKNFCATVVHENNETGIDVRDHHFRVSGRPIGKGAFGAVYRALDLGMGMVVAVKQSRYSIDTNDQDNLNWREFQTWSMLPAHPNVITFYGASKEVETRQLLLVLEFASGGSIITMYQNYRPIPEHLFLQHAKGIALGLKHLHDHNVIHGDMKPENVLTRSDGSVAITDFGCSRLTLSAPLADGSATDDGAEGPALNKSGGTLSGPWQLFGTAAFMAPEVITNEPDFKSDVWAYACTLGQLWLGRAPWADVPETIDVQDSIPLMFYIASHEDAMPFTPEQLAQTPRWMQRLAHRAFEHDVDKRANMAEVLSILAEYS